MRLKHKILCAVSITSIFLASCKEPEPVAGSSQFVLSKKDLANVEQKVRQGDCEAFDTLMKHYEFSSGNFGEEDRDWSKRKNWLNYAMNKPMGDCTGKEAGFYADYLLDESESMTNKKYATLMEAYRYANHGYYYTTDNIESVQRTINEINFELWKIRENEFKNAVPK
jgi:hypothetical protein